MKRILHVLSQRPHLTGSGVTLDALVRHAAANGYEQSIVCGIPADDPTPTVGGMTAQYPLRFVDPVPGMSDVMPYPSTVFRSMSPDAIDHYERGWRGHLEAVFDRVQPDVVHTHHAWILSAVVAELVAERGIPARVVVHAHATGLRQMSLCRPELGARVKRGLEHVHDFVVLHHDHRRAVVDMGIDPSIVHVVGAGYRRDVFGVGSRSRDSRRIVYAGKLSAAKGVEPLLDALDGLDDVRLDVAGDGAGEEAERIKRRLEFTPYATWHGMLPPPALADLLNGSALFVLPSFYEGLPLVIIEALACGTNVVSTRLDGIETAIAPHVGDRLTMVELPRMERSDRPVLEDLPAFVERLRDAIEGVLNAPASGEIDLDQFTWSAVFARIESVWRG